MVKLVPYSNKSHPQYPLKSHDFKKGAKGSIVVLFFMFALITLLLLLKTLRVYYWCTNAQISAKISSRAASDIAMDCLRLKSLSKLN